MSEQATALARIDFTPDQVGLIKRTICQGASDDELALFLGQCRRTGLDPFSRQIHAVKRWDSRQSREVMAIQVGVDGFRLVADRTGETDGQDGPYWCGPDGQWVDVWLDTKPPAAAKVTVYRRGQARGYTGVARWSEFAQTKKDGTLLGLWPKMPATMLAKCAECQALRKAFPAELSGLYAPEEMDQAGEPEKPAARQVETAAPPVEKAAPKSSPNLPPTGQELHRRLRDYDAKLAGQKLCNVGALLTHVTEAGVKAGYGANMTEWAGPAIQFAVDAVKAFDQMCRERRADDHVAVFDEKAFWSLVAAKIGKGGWDKVTARLNAKYGTAYGIDTRWLAIPVEQRRHVVTELVGMPSQGAA